MKIALHSHSTNSDGAYSPEQIVDIAKSQGAKICAVTDHDYVTKPNNTDGITYYSSAEFSADDFSNFHILGYNLQNSTYINAIYKYLNNLNDDKMHLIIQRLKDLNLDVDYDEVKSFAKGRVIDKTIIKQYLVVKKHVPDCKVAYSKYMGKGRPAYVKVRDLNATFIIKMIEACGGVAVLAHPTRIKMNNGELINEQQLDELVGKLVELGLTGLEVYNAKNDNNSTNMLMELCDKYGLIPLEGADFHEKEDRLVLDSQFMDTYKFVNAVQQAKDNYCINNVRAFHNKVAAPMLDIKNKVIDEKSIESGEILLQ